MAISFIDENENYVCTYTSDEDRHTECQYWGNICEQCSYYKQNEVKQCPIVKDECLSIFPCEKCLLYIEYVLDSDFENEDDEADFFDSLDFDDDLISFVNFEDEISLEDLPF